MAPKKIFLRLGSFSIKDGLGILFWEDRWLGNYTLQEQYPTLNNIVYHKSDTIAKIMETSPPNVTLWRDLLGQKLVSWHALLQRLANVHLQDGSNEFCWNLRANQKNSINSIYNAFI
jgi:hypothetical protein